MKLAIHNPDFSYPDGSHSIRSVLADTATAADEGGCAAFTVMDHWFQMESRADAREPMLEGYTTLGYLAALTSNVRLGLLVTGVTYRHPGLLAKTVATLDVLSGGRAFLGIGAAWYEREHRALGVPYPDLKERFGRLEEAIQVCEQMWSDDDGAFDGRYYQLAETICNPRPLQEPRPPILIGGSGEQKTLRLVARYADACNLFDGGYDVVKHKIEVLDRHCETEGRDPAAIQRTLISSLDIEDPDAFLSRMEQYATLGVDQVWVSPGPADPAAWVRRASETVVPRLAAL